MRRRDRFKQEQVKHQAIHLLVKEGLEGFSVNRLARACGISVATLYIYYKDKDDLIIRIAAEEMQKMQDIFLQNFDPSLSLEEGLRLQWKNRLAYHLNNPEATQLFELLRHSTYRDRVFERAGTTLSDTMRQFMKNAIRRRELAKIPAEVFWSIAFAPLYTLIRFGNEKASMGGRPFTLTPRVIRQTLDHVLKALKH
jgi:TetR/AcrR family transcriptional repressor of multidrug resistance operon